MARNYVRTVQDMERYYYGGASQTGYTYGAGDILKADAPLLSTTAGTATLTPDTTGGRAVVRVGTLQATGALPTILFNPQFMAKVKP